MIGLCSACCLFGLAGLSGGCSSGDSGSRSWAAGSSEGSAGYAATTRGKARDLTAAVSRSMSLVEMAVVEERPIDGGGREFSLLGLQGEEGALRVQYAEGTAQDLSWRRAEIDMRISAQIGLFGNEARERELVDSISRELRALAKQE